MEPEFDLAAFQRLGRGRLLQLVGAPVPDHHRPAAVFPFGDGALEVVVADRMVFDVGRQAALGGIEGRPFGNRPADQHPLHLQAEVVVESGGPVFLHHEPVTGARVGRALRFGRLAEIAFSLVLGE